MESSENYVVYRCCRAARTIASREDLCAGAEIDLELLENPVRRICLESTASIVVG
jgi:hypothetical protein